MSNYLRNAPENVIQSLANTVFARIRSEGGVIYSEKVYDYRNFDGFLNDNPRICLKKHRGVSKSLRRENIGLIDNC